MDIRHNKNNEDDRKAQKSAQINCRSSNIYIAMRIRFVFMFSTYKALRIPYS